MTEVLAALIDALLHDTSSEVREAAAAALVQLLRRGSVATAAQLEVQTALLFALRNDLDAGVRESVAKGLGRIAQSNAPQVPIAADRVNRQLNRTLKTVQRVVQIIILLPALITALVTTVHALAAIFGIGAH